MTALNAAEVARLAELARIHMDDAEITRLAGELQVIVDAVAKVSTVASDDVPPTSHPMPLTNVFREDEIGEVLNVDEVLSQAPEAQQGQFAVPQILGEDA